MAKDARASALAALAIPASTLAAARSFPVSRSVEYVARKADRVLRQPTRSHVGARDTLPPGGDNRICYSGNQSPLQGPNVAACTCP